MNANSPAFSAIAAGKGLTPRYEHGRLTGANSGCASAQAPDIGPAAPQMTAQPPQPQPQVAPPLGDAMHIPWLARHIFPKIGMALFLATAPGSTLAQQPPTALAPAGPGQSRPATPAETSPVRPIRTPAAVLPDDSASDLRPLAVPTLPGDRLGPAESRLPGSSDTTRRTGPSVDGWTGGKSDEEPAGSATANVVDPGSSSAVPNGEVTADNADEPKASETSAQDSEPSEPARKLVRRLMAWDDALELEGQPLRLSEALTPASDRQQQLRVARHYWELAAAVANYRVRLGALGMLENLKPREEDRIQWTAAMGEATARLNEAELAVVETQHQLADTAMLLTAEGLPLPADVPHVGHYRTYFEQIFASRAAPASLWRIYRSMPIERRAIDTWCDAANSAESVAQGFGLAYRNRTVPLHDVVAGLDAWQNLQRRFVAAVLKYNHDIAEYALTAVPGPRPVEDLTAMLIEVQDRATTHTEPETASPTSAARRDSGVQAARLDQPAGRLPRASRANNQPTLAPPRPDSTKTEPKPSAPDAQVSDTAETGTGAPETTTRVEGDSPSVAVPRRIPSSIPSDRGSRIPRNATSAGPETQPAGEQVPAMKSPAATPPADDQTRPLAPIPDAPGTTSTEERRPASTFAESNANTPTAPGKQNAAGPNETSRRANRPSSVVPTTWAAMYSGLVDLGNAAQAKQLAAGLHWDRALPDAGGDSLSLEAALQTASREQCNEAIRLYWLARQHAAEYQALGLSLESLQELEQLGRAAPDDAAATLDRAALETAMKETEASRMTAEIAWQETRCQLADLLGMPLNEPWPVPVTAPHAGPYLLNSDKVEKALAESWAFRRLEAAVPKAFAVICGRAAAVVQTDSLRTQAASTGSSLPILLELNRQQTDQTLAFLRALTHYNLLIADYVLLVLPGETDSTMIVESLVLSPSGGPQE